jgi:hypothetical protein
MARYRLLEAVMLDGAIVVAGTIIERPDDWDGPRRAVRKSHDRIDVANDDRRLIGEQVDELMYVRVED